MLQAFQTCAGVASINHVFTIQCSYGALLVLAFINANTTVRGGAVSLNESRSLKDERKCQKREGFWNDTTFFHLVIIRVNNANS